MAATTIASHTIASHTEQIGIVAGLVWQHLESEGPTKLARLIKQVDAPRDTVMQAVGWLAREDKLDFEEKARSRIVSIRID